MRTAAITSRTAGMWKDIDAEVDCVPAFHLQQVAKHAGTNFMQLPTHAGSHDRASEGSIRTKDIGIKLRHNKLRGSGAIVLLSDANNVRLPEAANLILARLKNTAIDFLDANFVFHGPQDESRCGVPVVAK